MGRNKLSMTVNLRTEEGQEALERLVAQSDGLIENNLPQSMDRQGISWERFSKVNPNLIMIRMPAFGLDGPYKGYRSWGNHHGGHRGASAEFARILTFRRSTRRRACRRTRRAASAPPSPS